MISIYDSKETVFTSNGLVVLSDSISCLVTEELNGVFECAIEYPLDVRGKWQYLLEDNIIKVDSQLFRIYHKVKTLNTVKINARHIYYDLLENLLEDVRPTSLSGQGALDYLLTRTQYAHPFTSMGDVGGINTKYFVRKNPVESIMGTDGLISVYGGELVRDNFLIKYLGSRGLDRGVLVAYGKNIQGIEETLDTSGICTRLMPIGKDGLLLPEKYINSPYIGNYPYPKIKVQEFSEMETEATLRIAGAAYMVNAKIDIPQFNYKIDFLELSKTEEYKNYAVLERVYLGDTVTVKHSRLSIDLKAKVIKTTKNILTGRIEKVELGSFKPNIATGISNAIQQVKQEITNVKSAYQLAIDNATALITGSNGGNVVIRQDANGKPYEILIMDTADVMTAVNVWRWSIGGFGFSSTGAEGPYGTAITMDGSIVGSFITALVISGEQIIAGIIQSKTGKWQFNLDGETITLGDALSFDGTNLVFGSGVTLSWNQVTGTPTVLSANDITSTVITKDFIASLNLLVGNEISMGANAYISWSNVTNQPSIPSQYTNAQALAAWVASGYKTYIDQYGVYTGTLTANQINGKIITSMTFTGPISAEDIMYIGTANASGTCRIDARSDGLRLQSHTPGNYIAMFDDGSIGFYKNDVQIASISNTGYYSGGGSSYTAKFA